jgi:hypothetical protein
MKPYQYAEYVEKNITNKLWFSKDAEISNLIIVFQKNIVVETQMYDINYTLFYYNI